MRIHYAPSLTNEEIIGEINAIAQDLSPYLQNETHDIGKILHHHEFLFTLEDDSLIHGTVLGVEYEKPFFILKVKQFKQEAIDVFVRKERAAGILIKMRERQKDIHFILEKYKKAVSNG